MTGSSYSPYGWLMLGGIAVSFLFWWRLAKRDSRLVFIYLSALGGAFIGAKLVYVAAEGWLHWHDQDRWIQLATGKSIAGGLLGGYAGVEIAKHLLGYRSATGDWFALITPVTIMLGRVGCLLHGCCLGRRCQASWFAVKDALGVPRWPAVEVEFGFNTVMLGVVLVLRRRGLLPGQHFHVYLMAYGWFRFVHEFFRDTPQVLGPLSGYQIASMAVFGLGLFGFLRRCKIMKETAPRPANPQPSVG